ncbi:MAG: polymer-forming cytoskeletal protein [Alphaproteobacteria bacterium]|nr:polymer-forming cytoskeletal protein [Alphaproteobacteria bacterium]
MSRAPVLAAVLGPGTRYEGDMTFEGRVRIDGHYVGRVYSEDWLELGPTGRIEGSADVADAVIAGEVDGELRVRDRLVLETTAWVRGKIDAGVLEVRPGARIVGEVRIAGAPKE